MLVNLLFPCLYIVVLVCDLMYTPKVEMSTLSKQKVENILQSLMDYLQVSNKSQLATKLGISAQAVSKWVKSGSFPVKKLKSLYPDLNADFLSTGYGSIVSGTKEPLVDYKPTTSLDPEAVEPREELMAKIMELKAATNWQVRLTMHDPEYLDSVLTSVELMRAILSDLEELALRRKSKHHSDS